MGGVWRGATAQSRRNGHSPVHQLETTKHRTTKNVAGGRDAVCQSRRQDGIDRGCDSGGRRRGGGVLVKRVVMVEGEISSHGDEMYFCVRCVMMLCVDDGVRLF